MDRFKKTISTTGASGIFHVMDFNSQFFIDRYHATMLLKAGTHPRVVQERLGHSSIATTLDIYSHTVPGMQKAAAERLDTLLPKTEEIENVGRRERGRV